MLSFSSIFFSYFSIIEVSKNISDPEEVRDLLKEMGTTAGMMGVNLGGPGKDNESWEQVEKGNGYKKSKPSNLPGTEAKTKKAILKASIRSKLKKR